ncbi:ankyrin repeat-containing domain protein [Xylaria curta]|nr:ankyrin repeat-containing domain protein [Xylaria curta]
MDMNIYQHDPLDSIERSFRLLRLKRGTGQEIQCELIPTSFDNNQLQYEAVSYTWGPNFKSGTINIRGKRLPVNFNLRLILHDLRSPETDRILWIDAICINQRNELEKGHQVQQMREIFSSAKRVLFCVGRPTDSTDLLMNSLRELQEKLQKLDFEESSIKTAWEEVQLRIADNHFSPVSEQLEALTCIQRQGLEYILTQDWFQRVWILQEVANARDALVYCGSKSISATVFVIGVRLLAVLKLMPWTLKIYPKGFRYAKATDERDKIFALFGLCTDTQLKGFPKVDYTKSAREIIRDTISYICHCDFRDAFNRLDSIEDETLSLLQHTRGSINVTFKMMQKAADNTMQENGIMDLLVQQPSAKDISLCKAESWTLSWWAAEIGHETLIRLLIEKGAAFNDECADLEAQSRFHYTPLYITSYRGHEAIMRLLLEKGANIETKGPFNSTPLHSAASYGYDIIAKLLLEKGAEIECTDRGGATPLHLASTKGHEAFIRLLLEKGANVKARDGDGKTPLQLAAEGGHKAIVSLLERAEADRVYKATKVFL